MANSVVAKKLKTPWRTAFYIMFALVGAGLVSYFFLKFLSNWKYRSLKNFEQTKTAELDVVKKKFGSDEMYEKYNYAELINKKYNKIPRSQRITLIVEKIEELKKMSYEWNAIILSDFTVSLEELSLKWKVSNLTLLYRSSKNRHYKSLIEMFQELDFVEKVQIKTYKNNWNMVEFILNAKLTLANGNVSK